MATPTEYTKSISGDFPNGKVNIRKLKDEIRNSSIIVALDYINTSDDFCYIWFKDVLSGTEQTILDNVIASHDGAVDTSPHIVKISEESVMTGGNFAAKTVKVTAASGQTEHTDSWWPFPISALSMKYNSKTNNEGDLISMILCPDKNIGGLTEDITSLPTAWTSQNYTAGDSVTFTDPVFGTNVYTCVVDTTSNQDPTNKSFWTLGFKIKVTSSVLGYTLNGYYLTLDNGTTTDNLGRVISVGSDFVLVENSPSVTYLSSNTIIKQNVYILKDFELGNSWCIDVGESKIGGSYLPSQIIVRLEYTNNYTSTQSILGVLEYLY